MTVPHTSPKLVIHSFNHLINNSNNFCPYLANYRKNLQEYIQKFLVKPITQWFL